MLDKRLPSDLRHKLVFIFDWDGTLFDSMAAKTVSFAGVVRDWLSGRGVSMTLQDVAQLYRRYSGEPRRAIFQKIAHGAGLDVSPADFDAMSEALFERNRAALDGAPLFDDALPCLEALLKRDRALCLSSSVPQAELSYFVERKMPASLRACFVEVLGSQPDLAKGRGHLARIGAATGAAPAGMLVVGDDIADRELSAEAGIDSILVDRDGHLPAGTPHISSLNELSGLL